MFESELIVGIFIGLLIGLGMSLWFKYFYNIGERSFNKGMDKMNRYYGIRYFQEVSKGKLDGYILEEDYNKDPYEEEK
ncbi:MAG: hypothetical protein ACJ0FR_02480 [Gammaproteobacteria bacterium]